MALLAEYALTPDVFDQTCYGSEELCGVHLQILKEVLLQEGMVRDLRSSEWSKLFLGETRPWHHRGKELLKKLRGQNRLIPCTPAGADTPSSDAEWCQEALATHSMRALAGIIVSDGLGDAYRSEPLVAPVGKLSSASWWSGRSPSLRLRRTLAEYNAALDLVLRHANSLMFIDPHVNPQRFGYKTFIDLLRGSGNRSPAPVLELHRVCYEGSGAGRTFPSPDDIESSFRPLGGPLSSVGLSLEIFVWDDFHDRYVISDLVGIQLPNGFDTTNDPTALTTWSRLGRAARDDIQREFDPASSAHALRHRFRVP